MAAPALQRAVLVLVMVIVLAEGMRSRAAPLQRRSNAPASLQ
jgi:hypothetical protein